MSISVEKKSVRALALEVLKRVEKDRAYLDRLMNHYLKLTDLSQKERGLFMELAYGVIRHQRLLDFYLEQILDRKISQTDITTRNILRLGAYQILLLDRIPAPAAVNESVKLGTNYAKPLINAVLRKLSVNKNILKPPEQIPELIQKLGVKYSHPDWLVELAIKILGEKNAEMLLQANNQRPELTLRINPERISRDDFLALLKKQEIASEPGKFSPFAIVLKEHKRPEDLPGYAEGLFTVQDQASQLVVLLLDPKPGEEILDACSAPGTKSLFIFQLMNQTGKLLSADFNQKRLRLMKKEAERLGISGIEICSQDLTKPFNWEKNQTRLFDKILLDAPCSGLGTIRKHPEIKWQRKPEDIFALADLQKQLLENVSHYLKPGGVLVYSTCTWTKEENEEVVAKILDAGGMELEAPELFLPDSAKELVVNKSFKSWTHLHFIDSFTAFRLRKK